MSSPSRQRLTAKIVRCGCGDPSTHEGDLCPQGTEETIVLADEETLVDGSVINHLSEDG
jgi:hypothetical protein